MKKTKGSLAISQILILVIGIVAISYAIGSGLGEVSAGDAPPTTKSTPALGVLKFNHGNLVIPAEIRAGKILGGEKGSEKAGLSLLSKIWAKSFVRAAVWAAVVYFGIQALKGFGLDPSLADAGSYGAVAGIIGGQVASELGLTGSVLGIGAPTLVGIGIGIVVALLTYKKEKEHQIQFTCYQWQPPSGGAECEKCNSGVLPCSEYQCKSLGKACQIVNAGTEEQKCVFVGRNDVRYPTIQPWQDALVSVAYSYKPDNQISPPDRGVFISGTGTQKHSENSNVKCIPAYTPFSFGITLDESAACKIDYTKRDNYKDMQFYFGSSSSLKYNHTQNLILPGREKEGDLIVENDGEYDLTVRCEVKAGNSNPANFIFKFCVDKGPDTTQPLIAGASLFDNTPISYNQTEIENFFIYVYDGSQVECKWDHVDRDYDNMANQMTCAEEVNTQLFYECQTTLTGLKSRFTNEFYFRCRDKSEQANTNTQPYPLHLIGTQPLVIDWVKPNGTVKDSAEVVKVTLEAHTSAGYNEGEATCEYKDQNGDGDIFFNTYSYQHSTDLYLTEGDYTYGILCYDLGGNEDRDTVIFRVESDSSPPIVVRTYQKENSLRIVTNEDASCVYDTVDCSYAFDDGIIMNTDNDREHYTDWDTQTTFYIKCKDEYDNQPNPDQCSITVRGVE